MTPSPSSKKNNGKLIKCGIQDRIATKAGRFYKIDEDHKFPSVTTILQVINKPALMPWAAKQERFACLEASAKLYEDIHGTPKMRKTAYLHTLESRIGKEKAYIKETEKAFEIGTQTHSIIEWNLRKALGQKVGPEPKIVDKALWAYMSFGDWYTQAKVKPLWIEIVVFSMEHCYAGTADLVAELDHDGRRVIAMIDFKTGRAVYWEAKLQLAAYARALAEMGHETPEIGLIVRLPKKETDPEFEVVVIDDLDEYFEIFLHAKALWKAQQLEG